NGNDDNGQNSGSAYVFDLLGAIWSQTSKLNASSGILFRDRFGTSVSLDGDRALIGAYLDDDNFANNNNSGSAYIFELSGGNWLQRAKLIANDASFQSWFGYSVSLLDNRALIGAYGENDQVGSVYIFEFSNNSWAQTSKETASDGERRDRFGYSVSLSEGNILVGADQTDDNAFDSGSVYIFSQGTTFTIGGTISGLAAGNTVEIENNLTDTSEFGNGSFTFATGLVDSSAYSVTVRTLPTTPNQTCSVTGGSNNNGTGTVNSANVTDITITCIVTATTQYSVGGTVSGLAASNLVSLQNNAGDDLTTNNGNFVFATLLPDLSNYAVTISTQPGDQTCVVNNSTGSINNGNVTNILVTCSDLELGVDFNSLNFGNVLEGSNNNLLVRLSNNASGDITITGLTDPTPPFSIVGGSCDNLPVTLLTGESCQLSIRFNPAGAGSFSGSLDIISNAPSSPDRVNLTGSVQIHAIPILNIYTLSLIFLIILMIAFRQGFKLSNGR
ncbi:MAG: choice-of-anchor D domain-containing protein, partial [Proteobacteria bacterium]|nr:choice-of-anchor D domain-containing protein [Pseudomonadota bacterium]